MSAGRAPIATRAVEPGERVRVHLNLHRGDWSVTGVTGAERGKVIANVASIALADVTFYVCEPMRLRSLAQGRRKVHGWAQGVVVDARAPLPEGAVEITYRPFDYGTFVTREGARPVARCEVVEFCGDRRAVARGAVS